MRSARFPRPLMIPMVFAVALAAAMPLAIAQGNKPPGAGGGGNKPPNGETAVNHLSFPAVEINGAGPAVGAFFIPAATPVLGLDFSYGCEFEETIEENKYPNTSCVSADGKTFYTAAQCEAPLVPNCTGLPKQRIYWQKTTTSDWSSDTSLTGLGRDATHVDWGDNLESRTWWDTATIRVETTPFGFISPTQRGLQMWHVYGQGPNELWGVRATEPTPGQPVPLPYVYDAQYAILHTTQARLNIAKMSGPDAACPTAPPVGPALPQGSWTYTGTGGSWSGSLLTLYDVPYTAELNIGGKYVYGFNWQLRRDSVAPAIGKTGWWRLTFYSRTSTGATSAVIFSEPGSVVLAPPPVAQANPGPLAPLAKAVHLAEAETGPLYKPEVVGGSDHLTYIDICIAGSQGGGGKKGPKPQ